MLCVVVLHLLCTVTPITGILIGVCKKALYCGLGNVYAETGEKCICNKVTADGIERTCKRCFIRKVAQGKGVFYTNPKGLQVECIACKAPHLMLDGKCAVPEQCPAPMARYQVGSFGGRCEAPFACVKGARLGGDLPGGNCKCKKPALCMNCIWGAGRSKQRCTRCAKHTLLYDGECIQPLECVAKGLLPIKGEGPQGGRCIGKVIRTNE